MAGFFPTICLPRGVWGGMTDTDGYSKEEQAKCQLTSLRLLPLASTTALRQRHLITNREDNRVEKRRIWSP